MICWVGIMVAVDKVKRSGSTRKKVRTVCFLFRIYRSEVVTMQLSNIYLK